jgi:hypothetical protein
MRKVLLFLAFCGFAASLWAADAFVGTWKFDMAKSKYAPNSKGAAVKNAMIVIGEVGTVDRESYTKTTYTDGSSTSNKWRVPRQGGIVNPLEGGTADTTYVVTRISGNEDYWTHLKNGKQVGVGHYVISKDGKTWNSTFKGIDDQGKPIEEYAVGYKQ